jgi:hypothetical protein
MSLQNIQIEEEDICDELYNRKTKTKQLKFNDLMYNAYFKCTDFKFWFIINVYEPLIEFAKKYRLELIYALITICFILILILC